MELIQEKQWRVKVLRVSAGRVVMVVSGFQWWCCCPRRFSRVPSRQWVGFSRLVVPAVVQERAWSKKGGS